MDQQVDKMQPGQLLEELRGICRTLGNPPDGVDLKALGRRADLLEQEILKRMAW